MTLPSDNPTKFCVAFIQRELDTFKESNMWMSYWPVMKSMIKRADELNLPFEELVRKFGYSDKFEGTHPANSYIWLTLEHIWGSSDFRKKEVIQARNDFKEIKEVTEEIVELGLKLSDALERQSELYETTGFSKPEYQFLRDLLADASEGNYLYKSRVSEKIESLTYQYDLKYWPSSADLIRAIAEFEESQPHPAHSQYPKDVINGRESDIKDFVIAFDSKFDEFNGLQSDFRFSNNAMADIINVILDLPVKKLATSDAVRIVRNRFKQV